MNKHDDEEVPQDGGKIHGQEQGIEQVLLLWLNWQALEEEVCDDSLISSSHVLCPVSFGKKSVSIKNLNKNKHISVIHGLLIVLQ